MAKRKVTQKNAVEAGETAAPVLSGDPFSGMGAPPGWETGGAALPYTRAVRTVFPGFNRGTRIGGLPTERIIVVHGPTHGGKTSFELGLAKSFLDAGHFVAFIDAENALDRLFAESILGAKLDKLPNFFFRRPATYEEAIDKVSELLEWMRHFREKHPEKLLLLLVDSINKLTPKNELKALVSATSAEGEEEDGGGRRGKKQGKGGENVLKGWGRMRAAYNQTWLDLLGPKLAASGAQAVFVAQEREDASGVVDHFSDIMDVFEIKGGRALKYDSSLLLRVTKVSPVYERPGVKESGVVAWRHQVRIWKSKVGAMEGRWTDTFFHLRLDSTLDTGRDLVEQGVELGVINQAGAWLSWRGYRANGVGAFVKRLDGDAVKLRELFEEVSAAVDAERASAGEG